MNFTCLIKTSGSFYQKQLMFTIIINTHSSDTFWLNICGSRYGNILIWKNRYDTKYQTNMSYTIQHYLPCQNVFLPMF